MEAYNNFVLRDKKLPLDYRTGRKCNIHQAENRTSFNIAQEAAKRFGVDIGYVICADDPFFFIDMDNAFNESGEMRPECAAIVDRFQGAFMERSMSGRGIHIIGSCDKSRLPRNRRIKARADDTSFDALSTEKRFVALTYEDAEGDPEADYTEELIAFIEERLHRDEGETGGEWTTAPIEGDGLSDIEIITKAMGTTSVSAAFGDGVTFAQLWAGDGDALSRRWPDVKGERAFDASRADMALAQHLAFWTGGNCEQMERLMRMCPGLSREKWDSRDDYIRETVLRAKNRQSQFYRCQMKSDGVSDINHNQALPSASSGGIPSSLPVEGAASGVCNSNGSRREPHEVPPPPDGESTGMSATGAGSSGNVPSSAGDRTPPPPSAPPPPPMHRGKLVEGSRFMTAREQVEYFAGCVYITECHRVLTPDGSLVKVEAFRAEYGGYTFELNGLGKNTPDAFKVFTQSELVDFPKARKMYFDPNDKPWNLSTRGVNTYLPIDVPCREGDVSLFLTHIRKLLPNESDQEILLDYMAACVQRPGDKFQWCPMIQGTEGNGKTLLSTVLCNAIGEEYFHTQDPEDLGNVFNSWIERSIVVSVEEIFINARYEMSNRMKAMVTNRRGPIHAKGVDQRTATNCAKLILFSNHKDGVIKHENDRRYAVFFTAQQSRADKERDGMDAEYFATLYDWAESEEGIAALNWYLKHREIKTRMRGDAPATTSQHEAIYESLGNEERIILEAIDNDEPGFRDGMIGAYYVDNKLRESGYTKTSPKRRGKILHNIGYESMGKVQSDNRRMRLYIYRDSEYMKATVEERSLAWKSLHL